MDRRLSYSMLQIYGNFHIRLIIPIMLLSWQRVITRQQKNTKEVQQFFLFNAKMVFIFVMICMQICLHYNCFQEIFSKKYFFPSSNGDLPESSRWLTASGVIIQKNIVLKDGNFNFHRLVFIYLGSASILDQNCTFTNILVVILTRLSANLP